SSFFFFQAEDGIRDFHVTGVQTCALPIYRQPMFSEIVPTGVRWSDGRIQNVDVILWCTGFRSSLDHLMPLMLREPSGGITMGGQIGRASCRERVKFSEDVVAIKIESAGSS